MNTTTIETLNEEFIICGECEQPKPIDNIYVVDGEWFCSDCYCNIISDDSNGHLRGEVEVE